MVFLLNVDFYSKTEQKEHKNHQNGMFRSLTMLKCIGIDVVFILRHASFVSVHIELQKWDFIQFEVDFY